MTVKEHGNLLRKTIKNKESIIVNRKGSEF
jgi:hypothetical protein